MADQAVDTYEVVDTKGNVKYDFEGHISAEGINLPQSATGIVPKEAEPDSLLGWYDTGGVLREYIYGFFPHHVVIYPGTEETIVGDAIFDVHSANTNLDTAYIRGSITSGASATLIDSSSRSSFVQTDTVIRRRMKIFSGVFTIPAGSGESSNYVDISHGFGNACTGFTAQQVGGDGFTIAITAKMVLNTSTLSRWRCTASSAMPGATPINFEFLFILYG